MMTNFPVLCQVEVPRRVLTVHSNHKQRQYFVGKQIAAIDQHSSKNIVDHKGKNSS